MIREKYQECITIQPESLAYTLAILTNPDMEIERTLDGMCINPITNEAEPDGKSHIYAVRHNNGVEVKRFFPHWKNRIDILIYVVSLPEIKRVFIYVKLQQVSRKHPVFWNKFQT